MIIEKMYKYKILYLYAEVMGYNVSMFKKYVTECNAELHVVNWDNKKKTPYIPPKMEGVTYYGKSTFLANELDLFVNELNPDIIVTSGWMDRDYIRVCKKMRCKGVPVVAASDTQWNNSLRQNIGRFYFKWFIKKAFSHAWVAGPYQYEYARILGFKKQQIFFWSLSADLDLFNSFYKECKVIKQEKYPHQFLYLGRFAPEKGLDILLEAWRSISNKKDWKLCLVGDGPLKEIILQEKGIEVLSFLKSKEIGEVVKNSGCFVLPSKFEPWALVLHEFTAAGLPVISSDICGAVPVFVTPGYNGYTFVSENSQDLTKQMQRIINSSDNELIAMSERSHELGQRINPEAAAKSLVSVLTTIK